MPRMVKKFTKKDLEKVEAELNALKFEIKELDYLIAEFTEKIKAGEKEKYTPELLKEELEIKKNNLEERYSKLQQLQAVIKAKLKKKKKE